MPENGEPAAEEALPDDGEDEQSEMERCARVDLRHNLCSTERLTLILSPDLRPLA